MAHYKSPSCTWFTAKVHVFFLDMNHYIDLNKNLGVGHGNNSVFTFFKKPCSEAIKKWDPIIRHKALNKKACITTNIILSHHLHILSKSYMKIWNCSLQGIGLLHVLSKCLVEVCTHYVNSLLLLNWNPKHRSLSWLGSWTGKQVGRSCDLFSFSC